MVPSFVLTVSQRVRIHKQHQTFTSRPVKGHFSGPRPHPHSPSPRPLRLPGYPTLLMATARVAESQQAIRYYCRVCALEVDDDDVDLVEYRTDDLTRAIRPSPEYSTVDLQISYQNSDLPPDPLNHPPSRPTFLRRLLSPWCLFREIDG
ncbi:hypothetical protein J6590_011350 [Homalodisca vitripennis]|nr:hypothetical protein J6590_011350 [Homalodisca vitripennis]